MGSQSSRYYHISLFSWFVVVAFIVAFFFSYRRMQNDLDEYVGHLLVVAPPFVEVQLLVDPVEIARDSREDVGKSSRRAVVDQPTHHPRDVVSSLLLAHQWTTGIAL